MTNQPIVNSAFDPDTYTATHVVTDPSTRATAIIDSVLNYCAASGRTGTHSADAIIEYVERESLRVDWILETHVHADHLSAAPYLREKLGGLISIGRGVSHVQETFGELFNEAPEFARDGSQFDRLFKDDERFQLGSIEARVMSTPGHTPACSTYVIGDAAFVGDTLFMPDFGTARCDFPGGDASTLFASIQRIYQLPDETRMFLCHDYKAPGRDQFVWETTVGEQKTSNIHVCSQTGEDVFVAMRRARDASLSMPALILPAVQINMRAGQLPEPSDNGLRYLKIPLNAV
jgi:glyoxylase-like metal-dependent hydrolase (beta-lactamase superfamily II)